MDIKLRIERIVFTLVGLLVIAGCNVPASSQLVATMIPTNLPTYSAPTSVPVTTTIPTNLPTDISPTSVPSAPNVTLADNGKTIMLQSGQSFLLKLGENYDWTVTVADQNILKRMINVMVIRGAQGIYIAGKPGSTTLSALGDPMCLQSKPACAVPSIQFKITIIVK
jgi:hypothetical protein